MFVLRFHLCQRSIRAEAVLELSGKGVRGAVSPIHAERCMVEAHNLDEPSSPQSGSRLLQVHWHTFWFRNIENATVHRSFSRGKWCQAKTCNFSCENFSSPADLFGAEGCGLRIFWILLKDLRFSSNKFFFSSLDLLQVN